MTAASVFRVESVTLKHEVDRLQSVVRFEESDEAGIRERLNRVCGTFARDPLGHCVEHYLAAELDCQTPGNVGIGRNTADIPRFGGYFRKWLSEMDGLGVSLFQLMICSCILRGYLCRVIWEPDGLRPTSQSKDELRDHWIAQIYTTDPEDQTDELADLMWACSEEPLLKLKGLLKMENMRGGGLLSEDRSSTIMIYYPHAGYRLRIAETNGDQ